MQVATVGSIKTGWISMLILVMLLLLPTLGFSADWVSKIEATATIEGLIADIDGRYLKHNNKLYYGNAEQTLKQAFQQGGVGPKAMRYAESWGNNGLWLDWAYTKNFYDTHKRVLQYAINLVNKQDGLSQSDLAYLEKGMTRWRQEEPRITQGYQTLIKAYVDRAKATDEIMKIQDRIHQMWRQKPVPHEQMNRLQQQIKQIEQHVEQINRFMRDHNKNQLAGRYSKLIVFSQLDSQARIAIDTPKTPEDCTPYRPQPPTLARYPRVPEP